MDSAATSTRRFRRRGGAKKNKNKKNPSSSAADHIAFDSASAPSTTSPSTLTAPPILSSAPTFVPAGTTLPPDLFSYLQKLSADLLSLPPDDPDTPDHASLLARNGLTTVTNYVAELSRDSTTARVLESLLPHAGAEGAIAVIDSLFSAAPFVALSTHVSASHVLQTALTTASSPPESLRVVIASMSQNDFLTIATDRHGSHVLRAALATLVGIPSDEPPHARLDDSVPAGTPYFHAASQPSAPVVNVLRSLSDTILQKPEVLVDLPYSPHGSASLQALLSAFSISDLSTSVSVIATSVASSTAVPELLQSQTGSRLLDRILLVGTDTAIHTHFSDANTLLTASQHPVANFPVQRFLSSLPTRAKLAAALSTLLPQFPTLLGEHAPRDGVVLALARATERVGDLRQQTTLSREVARAINATGADTKLLPLALALRGIASAKMWRSILESSTSPMEWELRHGALQTPRGLPRPAPVGVLLARTLLRLKGAAGQPVRDAMATLSARELVAMLIDPGLSRVLEPWLADGDAKRAEKIAMKILAALDSGREGRDEDAVLVAACAVPCAAMVIAQCVARLSADQRRRAMDRLAAQYDTIAHTGRGEIVLRKCRVEMYMRRNGDWEREESARETKERLFADILADEEVGGGDEGNGVQDTGKKGKRKMKAEDDGVCKNKKRARVDRAEQGNGSRIVDLNEVMDDATKDEREDQNAKGEESNLDLPSGVVYDAMPMDLDENGNGDKSSGDICGWDKTGLGAVMAAIESVAKGPAGAKQRKKERAKEKKMKKRETAGSKTKETIVADGNGGNTEKVGMQPSLHEDPTEEGKNRAGTKTKRKRKKTPQADVVSQSMDEGKTAVEGDAGSISTRKRREQPVSQLDVPSSTGKKSKKGKKAKKKKDETVN